MGKKVYGIHGLFKFYKYIDVNFTRNKIWIESNFKITVFPECRTYQTQLWKLFKKTPSANKKEKQLITFNLNTAQKKKKPKLRWL